MDAFGLPTGDQYDIKEYIGNGIGGTSNWITWNKPKGKSMCQITLIGAGGMGGSGAIGAASTAAGGGGGGSGGTTITTIPLAMIPDTLYLNLPNSLAAAAAYVAVYPSTAQGNTILATANSGGAGGNASGVTAGAAGSAAGATGGATMIMGNNYSVAAPGLAGTAGGTTGSATGPNTTSVIQRVIGGSGGGGVGATSGSAGGSYAVAGSVFPPQPGGIGAVNATDAPGRGTDGYRITQAGGYWYGGTGGGSTHGAATGTGLVQAAGGNGGIGCGGGGSGGALTGSTAAPKAFGGPSYCLIVCW